MYDSPFSWDKKTWSKENETRTVKQNGRYKVYAEDNLGNISELEILVDCFPQVGRYELRDGNIITSMSVSAEWEENLNKNVQITLNNDLNIVGWQISTSNYVPNEFVMLEQIQNEENNQMTTNSNSNQINSNVSIPDNVVLENITSQNNLNTTITQTEIPRRTDPIVINTALEINKEYYLWIKDRDGNYLSQMFKIFKAEI